MALVLGILVGLVLGLTGAGGAALAVPLLMWSMGWSLERAAPAALLTACCAAALGTAFSWTTAHVRYRAALLMASTGLAAVPLGHRIAASLPAAVIEGLFAVVLAVVALRMWLQAGALAEEGVVGPGAAEPFPRTRATFCRLDRSSGRIVWTPACAAGVAGVGAGAGVLAGMFGVGGGFVIVPSLRAYSELPLRSTIATSLMAVALISGGGAGVAIVQSGPPSWPAVVPFIAGAALGMLLGRPLAQRLPLQVLQRGFAAFLLAAAAAMALRLQ